MLFWLAVEVKSGESFKVNVEGKFYCRISQVLLLEQFDMLFFFFFAALTIKLTAIICTQASIGEIEKEKNKSLYLYITINGKKACPGNPSPQEAATTTI